MNTINIKITGMTCEHCAKSAEDALNSIEGVNASVSFDNTLATVKTNDMVDNNQLVKAIESKGYSAEIMNNDDSSCCSGRNNKLHIAIVGTGSGAFAAASDRDWETIALTN